MVCPVVGRQIDLGTMDNPRRKRVAVVAHAGVIHCGGCVRLVEVHVSQPRCGDSGILIQATPGRCLREGAIKTIHL
jgi:hypothetical protein